MDRITVAGHKTLDVLVGLCRRGFLHCSCRTAGGSSCGNEMTDALWILETQDAAELRTLIAKFGRGVIEIALTKQPSTVSAREYALLDLLSAASERPVTWLNLRDRDDARRDHRRRAARRRAGGVARVPGVAGGLGAVELGAGVEPVLGHPRGADEVETGGQELGAVRMGYVHGSMASSLLAPYFPRI